MHARMTIAHAQPDRFDEAVAAVGETFIPAAREQPGYGGFLLLTDPTTHQLIGISFWAQETDLEASGATDGGYYTQQLADFAALLSKPPQTTTHQVAVREP